jgi:hypothetical protein
VSPARFERALASISGWRLCRWATRTVSRSAESYGGPRAHEAGAPLPELQRPGWDTRLGSWTSVSVPVQNMACCHLRHFPSGRLRKVGHVNNQLGTRPPRAASCTNAMTVGADDVALCDLSEDARPSPSLHKARP